MNWIDLIVIIILGVGLFQGFQRGFIQSLAGFVAIGLAIWIGLEFSVLLEGFVTQYEEIPDETVGIVSLILSVLLVYFGIKILAKFVSTAVHIVGLGLLNSLAGAAFSGLLNLFAICAIFYYLNGILIKIIDPELINSSKSMPYLLKIIEILKLNIF